MTATTPDGITTTDNVYNLRGARTNETVTRPDGTTYETIWTYDELMRVTGIELPDRATSIERDVDGRDATAKGSSPSRTHRTAQRSPPVDRHVCVGMRAGYGILWPMADTGMRAYANPFNAGFGVDPPYMAGRDAVVHRVLADLRDGPGRARYITVALGDRGVGKTALENRLRDYVTREFGWATFRWTAGLDASFAAALDDAYDRTIAELSGSRRRNISGGSVSLNAGILKASVDLSTGTHRPSTVAGQLRALGIVARDARSTVVVFVDELQAGDPGSLAALSAGFQETNGERLPIALIAVGLPTARARLRRIPGATFIERQRPVTIGNLDEADAYEALARPIADTDRDHDPDIFAIMLATAGGYPYAIQLVGEHTWDEAADSDRITIAHAIRGTELAQADLNTIYRERWNQLTDRQQSYLAAVIEHLDDSGSAPSNLVAATYGADTRSATQTRRALIEYHQLLYSDTTNSLRLALPGLDTWIAEQINHP